MSSSTLFLAVKDEESQKHGPPPNLVQNEESQEPQRLSPFFSLDLSLFQRVGKFLPPHDVLQLAQVSQYCLKSISSHLNLELSLENKILTEEDFLSRFGENGYYKEAQCFSLSGSSFHPTWLRHLTKNLKALKLRRINTQRFSEYEFPNSGTMKIKMMKVLDSKTFSKLKFLDISQNDIGNEEARSIANHLTALTSLDISDNRIGATGAHSIAKHLTALTSLNISLNLIEDEGARYIAQHLKSLTTLGIDGNQLGKDVIQELGSSFLGVRFCFDQAVLGFRRIKNLGGRMFFLFAINKCYRESFQ